MRFVKFNYLNDKSFTFCLDDVTIIEEDDFSIIVTLRNDHKEIIQTDTEAFFAKVFSDEHDGKEYSLIEIEEKKGKQIVDWEDTV